MKNPRHRLLSCIYMASATRNIIFILFVSFLFACSVKEKKQSRPRDPWAFRSVLDKKPRMLTLALDTACYAAYDLADCKIYKVWKGGVTLEGAAYTDKKNVQPASWGTSYSDDLENKWSVNSADSFKIASKGYSLKDNNIIIRYAMILANKDTVLIEESPQFIPDNNMPRFEASTVIRKILHSPLYRK
jgi:cytochrome c